MDMKTSVVAYWPVCYLITICIYKEIWMECEWIHLIENGINYYILVVYTLV